MIWGLTYLMYRWDGTTTPAECGSVSISNGEVLLTNESSRDGVWPLDAIYCHNKGNSFFRWEFTPPHGIQSAHSYTQRQCRGNSKFKPPCSDNKLTLCHMLPVIEGLGKSTPQKRFGDKLSIYLSIYLSILLCFPVFFYFSFFWSKLLFSL